MEKHKDREWTRYKDDLGEVMYDGWSGLGELVGDLYGDMYERLKERGYVRMLLDEETVLHVWLR